MPSQMLGICLDVGHLVQMRIVCVIQFCLSRWYLPLRLPNVFFKCLLHILSSDLCPQSLFFSYVNYSLCIKLLLVDHQNGAQRLNHFFCSPRNISADKELRIVVMEQQKKGFGADSLDGILQKLPFPFIWS